jgi:tetratricopeptide (TPR) repeat protein
MMRRSRDGLIVLVLIARSASAQAIAGPPLDAQARTHFDKALADYSAANYRAASVEFELAYGLDARRELLFAWAQAERLSGNCDRAVMLYKRFLEQSPTEAEAAKATRQIDRCGGSPTTTPSDDVAVERPAPPPPAPAPPREVERSRWWVGLVAGGGAIAVTGGVFVVLAHSDDNAAAAATVYGDARHFADEADTRRAIGVAALATGGALVVGGFAWAWWTRDREPTYVHAQIGPKTIGIAGAF